MNPRIFRVFLILFCLAIPFSAEAQTPKTSPAKKPDPFDSPDFVKTPKQLQAELAAIRKMKIEFSGQLSPGVPAAVAQELKNPVGQKKAIEELRTLMMYRAVVGVPYADMTLDRQQTAHALAAAMLLSKNDQLSHAPACPPGFPQDIYQLGHTGAASSNIHMDTGGKGTAESVRGYMNDSDPGNIDRLGHRRWCINPSMKTTGFGEYRNQSAVYSAMWSFDRTRDMTKFDYDFIAFPARGLTPVDFLDADWAWNVSLNPKKYKLAGRPEDVRVRVTPSEINPKTAKFKKGPRPMPVDSMNVSQEGFGIALCVIFRPQGLTLTPGTAFCVEIDGFSDMTGKPCTIQYWVVFIRR